MARAIAEEDDNRVGSVVGIHEFGEVVLGIRRKEELFSIFIETLCFHCLCVVFGALSADLSFDLNAKPLPVSR